MHGIGEDGRLVWLGMTEGCTQLDCAQSIMGGACCERFVRSIYLHKLY